MAAQATQRKLGTLLGALQAGSLFLWMETLLPGMLRREVGYPAGDIVYYAALALIACGVIGFMGAWRETGFRRPDSWRVLWWFSPLLLVGLYQTRWHVYADVGATATYALYYLAQSVQARAIFDGLMVRSLLPLGRWIAAIVPAICQAALIGFEFVLVPPEPGFGALLLLIVASTLATSFAYAAVRIRTGLVWPLIVIDVLTSILYYMVLPPTASPYPLTTARLVYYAASISFGVVMGVVALSVGWRRMASVNTIAPTPEHPVEKPRAPKPAGQWLWLSALAAVAGAATLACGFGAYATGLAGRPPAYQAGSQHAYFAARPGTGCDSGSGYWTDNDPEDSYTCRSDGLQITQLKFDYAGEAYFAFAGDDESSVPFEAHTYQALADAQIVGGNVGTCVGLHVHIQDFQGRQWFYTCNDGTWFIGRCDQSCGKDTQLLSGKLPSKTNRFVLEVDVTDSVMRFVVNGAPVATLHDATYSSTDQIVLALGGPADTNNKPSAVFSNFRYTPIQ